MHPLAIYALNNLPGPVPASLQFIGNGSEQTSIYQNINASPNTHYSVSLWAATYGTVSAGVMEFSLVDNFNNVIANNAGNNNLFTVSHTALSAVPAFLPFGGAFQTPNLLPAQVRFRIRASTAITNAGRILIQTLALTPSRQAYNGGPYVILFSGLKKLVAGDSFTVVISNNYGGLIQSAFNRIFNMGSMNLVLPSTSGSPTIPDSLIPTAPPPSPEPPPVIP